jgi:hypothetical protein
MRSNVVSSFVMLVTLLHINIAAVAQPCVQRDLDNAATPAAAHGHHEQPSTPSENDECEHPLQLACCQMAGSCGMALSINPEIAQARLRSPHLSPISNDGLSHGLNSLPPEPPPPKA